MSLLYEITAPVPFTRQPKVPSGNQRISNFEVISVGAWQN